MRALFCIAAVCFVLLSAPTAGATPPHYMVPNGMVADLPKQAEVLHDYGERSLVRVQEQHLPGDVALFSSRVDASDQLSYRSWRGSVNDPAPPAGPDSGYFLVSLIGPVDPAWRDAVEAEGVEIVDHASPHGLVVRAHPSALGATVRQIKTSTGRSALRGVRPLPRQSRSAPALRQWASGQRRDLPGVARAEGGLVVRAVLFPGVDRQHVEQAVGDFLLESQDAAELRLVLVSPDDLRLVLDRTSGIAYVEPVHERHLLNNLTAQSHILASEDVWASTPPHTGDGLIVGVSDSGLDLSHTDFPAGSVVATSGDMVADGNAHGTHVAGSIAGRGAEPSPTNTFECGDLSGPLPDGRGMAWESNLSVLNVFQDMPLREMVEWHWDQDARIVNNSWGLQNDFSYSSPAALMDELVRDAKADDPGNQAMSLVFAAGNSGPDPERINSPGSAKNVITVGASQNHRCGRYIPSNCDGPDLNAMACFSSRGPSQQRIKPDLVAPGTDVLSSASSDQDLALDQSWTGDHYGLNSGTSMASPLVTGSAALFKEAYLTETGSLPSPSMTKAALINTATDLGFGFPSMDQGWGRVNIHAAISGPPQGGIYWRDQSHSPQLSTGESWIHTFDVRSDAAPLKFTVVWTDPPGAAGCESCEVNDLDLVVVSPDGTVYRGNQFSGAWSTPDPTGRDSLNNVENVFIENPAPGEWSVEVVSVATATNPPDLAGQDFSFAISGDLNLSLEFTAQPQDTTVGDPLPSPIVVNVRDPLGQLTDEADGETVVMSLPGGDLHGTTSASVDGNEVSFDDLAVEPAGEGYQLVSSSDFSVEATSAGFDVEKVDPSLTAQIDPESSQVAGEAFSVMVSVDGHDPGGYVDVAAGSDLLCSIDLSVTNECDLTATESGNLSIEIIYSGDQNNLAADEQLAYEITHAPPDRLAFSVQPTDVVAGEAVSPAVEVRVLDEFGNIAVSESGRLIELALSSDVALQGNTGAETVEGVAVFDALGVELAGSDYVLEASSSALSGSSSEPFSVSPAPPVSLTFEIQPSASTVDENISPAPRVISIDEFGNASEDESGCGVLVVLIDGGEAVLGGDTGPKALSGDGVDFDGLTVDQVVSDASLEAECDNGALNGARSETFSVSGLATTVSIVDISPGTSQIVGDFYVVSVEVSGDDPTGLVDVSNTTGDLCTIDIGVDSDCALYSAEAVSETVEAVYSGDQRNAPSATTAPYEIRRYPTSLTISSIDPPEEQTADEPYTITISLDAFSPSGSVFVDDGLESSCEIPLPDEQSCELTTAEVGDVTITADYFGDDNNQSDLDRVYGYDIAPVSDMIFADDFMDD